MHGAAYLKMTADHLMIARCNKLVRWFGILFIVGFSLAGVWLAYGIPGLQLSTKAVSFINGGWLINYKTFSWFIIMPALGFIGALMAILFAGNRYSGISFVGSSLAALGAVLTFGGSLYPFILPSSINPNQSLTVWNATSSAYSLHIMFAAAVIMLPIIILYTIFVYWKMTYRVTLSEVGKGSPTLY